MEIRNLNLAKLMDNLVRRTSLLDDYDVVYRSGSDGVFMEINEKTSGDKENKKEK
jgi:hypothetical protein